MPRNRWIVGVMPHTGSCLLGNSVAALHCHPYHVHGYDDWLINERIHYFHVRHILNVYSLNGCLVGKLQSRGTQSSTEPMNNECMGNRPPWQMCRKRCKYENEFNEFRKLKMSKYSQYKTAFFRPTFSFESHDHKLYAVSIVHSFYQQSTRKQMIRFKAGEQIHHH